MRLELLYNPRLLIERLAIESNRHRRLGKLKKTVADTLKLGHIDSLELLELTKSENPKIFYDIGANVGTWSLLAKAIFPDSIIHAFEPIQTHHSQFNRLVKNIEKVTLHSVALGSSSQIMKMNVTNFSDASSFLERVYIPEESFKIYKEREEKVTVVSLDDYQKEHQIPLPDLIKLDIQGYELEALKGAVNCLKHSKFVICEVSFIEVYKNQPLFEEITNFLNQYDFSLYSLGVNTSLGKKLRQTDALYVNNIYSKITHY